MTPCSDVVGHQRFGDPHVPYMVHYSEIWSLKAMKIQIVVLWVVTPLQGRRPPRERSAWFINHILYMGTKTGHWRNRTKPEI